jgi:hypothetical protein
MNKTALNFHYKEFKIKDFRVKLDSRPGWDVIPELVGILIERGHFYGAWVLIESKGWYNLFQKIECNDAEDFRYELKKLLWKDVICIIKTSKDANLDLIFDDYSETSTGIIKDNQKSEIFPESIEVDEWFSINEDEILLAVWHDGEPVFILSK